MNKLYYILLIMVTILFSKSALFASYDDAMNLFKEGKYQESLKEIADELEIANDLVKDSPNYKLRYLAAHNHWKMKNYKNAIIHLTRCSDIKPESVDPLIDRSLVLLDANRNREVITMARKILKMDKNNATAYYLLGEVKLRWKSYWGAREFFQKALAIDTELYRGWNSLGMTFMNLKKYSKANTAFSMALAMKPENPIILNNLALSCVKLKKYDEALESIKKASEKDSENEMIKKNLSKIEKLAKK